jgi:hypothetical protein
MIYHRTVPSLLTVCLTPGDRSRWTLDRSVESSSQRWSATRGISWCRPEPDSPRSGLSEAAGVSIMRSGRTGIHW